MWICYTLLVSHCDSYFHSFVRDISLFIVRVFFFDLFVTVEKKIEENFNLKQDINLVELERWEMLHPRFYVSLYIVYCDYLVLSLYLVLIKRVYIYLEIIMYLNSWSEKFYELPVQ